MAGNTFVTRAGFQVSADTGYSSRVTRAGLVGTFTTSFSTRLTRAGFGPSVWTAYLTRTTRAGFSVSVITCSSSSYIPPAATGLITLTATDTSGGSPQISLVWNAPAAMGQFTYTLTRGTTPGGETTTLLSGSASLSYVDSAVTFHQQYYYIITAVNQCASQTTSNEATASPGCTLPSAPMRLKAIADNGAGVIRLIWNPVPLP